MTVTNLDESVATFAVPLREVTRADTGRVGAKAAKLGELAQAGFSIPDGFVLTTDAFERFAAHNQLGVKLETESDRAPSLPPEIDDAVMRHAVGFEESPLAVRSSGVLEDSPDASFAGQYETVLGVAGAEALREAVVRCWSAAFDVRVAEYGAARGVAEPQPLALLIQRMVGADAAGVAFTANPITGKRDESTVSAVRGLGERLVSGHVTPDEWIVRGSEPVCRSAAERAIDADQARAVAELARRVEGHFGRPQDVEWAIAGGELFLLQARPITALPDPIDWTPPAPGAWGRHFRLGEWLGDPVTPLFESWLLRRLDERLYANYQQIAGVPKPAPLSVNVNGWYFCSLNFLPPTPAAMLRMMVRHVLPKALIQPRRVAMMMPNTAKFGVELFVRDWRRDLEPRYHSLVESSASRVDTLEPAALIELIDELADAAGDYFTSMTCVSGFAWKAEMPLAAFCREHLEPSIGYSHQVLLGGFPEVSLNPSDHAVDSLDWFFPTSRERRTSLDPTKDEIAERRSKAEAARLRAEAEARAALAGDSKRLAKFEKLLATAQRFARIREEQTPMFTLPWPVMRRAVVRLGGALVEHRVLTQAEDVFFLTRDELFASLVSAVHAAGLVPKVVERRERWDRQRRLVPPLIIGEMSPMARRMFDGIEQAFRGGAGSNPGSISGLPASAGRATGRVRVVRNAEEFERLESGEVLVAPMTTPAWTPLFARAAAVVTDTGSPVAHASLVAREFGLPAVVATGTATQQLHDGQVVIVDGNAGTVEVTT